MSATITDGVIAKVAKLASRNLLPEKVSAFVHQIEPILEHFESLSKVDTVEVEPTYQVTGLKSVLREDVIDTDKMLTQAQALQNAPLSKNGYFVIKSISKK